VSQIGAGLVQPFLIVADGPLNLVPLAEQRGDGSDFSHAAKMAGAGSCTKQKRHNAAQIS
jgi:hypothetical protein